VGLLVVSVREVFGGPVSLVHSPISCFGASPGGRIRPAAAWCCSPCPSLAAFPRLRPPPGPLAGAARRRVRYAALPSVDPHPVAVPCLLVGWWAAPCRPRASGWTQGARHCPSPHPAGRVCGCHLALGWLCPAVVRPGGHTPGKLWGEALGATVHTEFWQPWVLGGEACSTFLACLLDIPPGVGGVGGVEGACVAGRPEKEPVRVPRRW
jgi:hypothetical protein